MKKSCLMGLTLLTIGCAASSLDVQQTADQARAAGLLTGFGGEWKWLASEGSIAGVVRNPASEGFTVVFQYTASGDVRTLRNDSLVDVSRYTATGAPAADSTSVWVRYEPALAVFPFAQLEEHLVRFGGKGSLVFEEPCCDRYVHYVSSTSEVR